MLWPLCSFCQRFPSDPLTESMPNTLLDIWSYGHLRRLQREPTDTCSVALSALTLSAYVLLFTGKNTNKQENEGTERRQPTRQAKKGNGRRQGETDSSERTNQFRFPRRGAKFPQRVETGGDIRKTDADPLSLKTTGKTGLTGLVQGNGSESIWGHMYVRLTFKNERNWNAPKPQNENCLLVWTLWNTSLQFEQLTHLAEWQACGPRPVELLPLPPLNPLSYAWEQMHKIFVSTSLCF